MKQILMSVVLAAVILSGCATGSLDTIEKRGVAFCASFASVLGKMTLFRQTENMSAGDILQINAAVAVIEPYCTNPTVEAPARSVVDALDVLLLIQLNKRS